MCLFLLDVFILLLKGEQLKQFLTCSGLLSTDSQTVSVVGALRDPPDGECSPSLEKAIRGHVKPPVCLLSPAFESGSQACSQDTEFCHCDHPGRDRKGFAAYFQQSLRAVLSAAGILASDSSSANIRVAFSCQTHRRCALLHNPGRRDSIHC